MTDFNLERIQRAQRLLNSLTDIRPEYASRTVMKVEEDFSKPNTVLIVLDNGLRFHWTGLFAAQILRNIT